MSAIYITVQVKVAQPIEVVWQAFTSSEHIVNWNAESEDWHTLAASNDLQVGGTFVYTFATRDGSVSLDFCGTYERILAYEHISYVIEDGRRVTIDFRQEVDGVMVIEKFEPGTVHNKELQQAGWQAVLDRFKIYVENSL